MLTTMPDLTWVVYVKDLILIYRFSRTGTVVWEDPFVRRKGPPGRWSFEKGAMRINWDDWTTDVWGAPVNPRRTRGERRTAEGAIPLTAEAQNYFLHPGDVVYGLGDPIKHTHQVATVVYADGVRTGGTIAWLCCNPGNIMNGEKYGSIPGKRLHVKGWAPGLDGKKKPVDRPYSIFPDEETGFKAVVAWLRAYGRRSFRGAMHDYAPAADGNNPDGYAARLAAALKVGVDTPMSDLTDDQLAQMAKAVTGVEVTEPGRKIPNGSDAMPLELRGRLMP